MKFSMIWGVLLCFVNFCCQHTLRTERKEKGYSPFKVGKDWYLALYDNEQEATDEEFEQFNKMNVEKGLEFLKEIYPDLQQKVVDILKEKCENIDTLYAFLSSNRKIFTNSKDVQIISDKIFDFNLNLSD